MTRPRVDLDAIRSVIGPYAEGQTSLADRSKIYEKAVGYLPPRVEARLNVTGALDPETLDLQEKLRLRLQHYCFDEKTLQLIIFAMLLVEFSEAAQIHAMQARKAGASWEELQGIVHLGFLFRGITAGNKGAEIIANLARDEAGRSAETSPERP